MPKAWAAVMRVFALLFAAACSNFVAGFDVPFDVPPLTLTGAPGNNEATFFFSIDLTDDPQAHMSASTVTVSSLSFSIANDSGCFDFIDTVTLSVSSTKANTTLPQATVATATSPGCVQVVTLDLTTIDLEPYLQEGAKVSAVGSGIRPTKDVSFSGHVVLHATL